MTKRVDNQYQIIFGNVSFLWCTDMQQMWLSFNIQMLLSIQKTLHEYYDKR